MITLALSQLLYFIYLQAPFTHGEDGIQGIPQGYLFGIFNLSNPTILYYVILAGFLFGFLLIFRTINSPFGEVLKAIRENEPRAISLGYKTDQYKLLAYILSGTLAGFAGALKVFVAQNASLTDVEWTMSGRNRADDAGRRSRHRVRPGGRRLRDHRHAAISGRLRAMGDGDPGRDLRGLRADVPPRRDRRDRAFFPPLALTGPISGTFPAATKRWMTRFHGPPAARFPRKMVYDSFVTGRLGRPFHGHGHRQMLRWFRAFLPREERFFDLFARHSQTVVQGALALQGMLRGGEETPVFCQRVNQFENDADNITREVLTAVRRTFITPFDRGDIKNLITSMDDAIDQMQQTAKAVILFEVRTFEPPMREMGTLLVECANLVGRALPLLQSIGANVAMLTAITEELTKLEGRVDDLHDIGLKELFLKHRNANAMDFIVGAEIYDHLEKVADRFDDVANEINSIVIEQV